MNVSLLLQIQNLQIEAGVRTQLSVPSLEIYRGEVLAIIGPNGAAQQKQLQL